jgi:S1-C subfamily serine protease
VEIVEVAEGSPAAKAGLRAEDMIIELDGVPVDRVDSLQRVMTEDAIGRAVPVRVLRGDRWLDLELLPVELAG